MMTEANITVCQLTHTFNLVTNSQTHKSLYNVSFEAVTRYRNNMDCYYLTIIQEPFVS